MANWNDVKLQEKIMEKLNGKDGYYHEQEILQGMLREFLRTDFTKLSKKEFLKLCCLVSRHRPMEPHQFLTLISMNVFENEEAKK